MLAKHEAKEFTLGLHRQPRTLFTKRYQVRDDLLKIGSAGETTSGAPTAKQIIESRGIEFPSGGRAEFDKDRSSLVVTTTSEQFELIDAFVESIAEEVVKQVEVTVRFIEITDDNIEELLGFDWLNSFSLEQDTEDL